MPTRMTTRTPPTHYSSGSEWGSISQHPEHGTVYGYNGLKGWDDTMTTPPPEEHTMNGNAVLWAIFLVLGIIVMIIWLLTRFI